MAINHFSPAVRNARADATESTIGPSPTLKIRSGSIPANTAATLTGTVLATMVLPSDWLTNASAGVKSLSGLWSDSAADATGTATYFTIEQAGTIHWLGDVGATGSGASIEVSTTSFITGQTVTITADTITEGNA